MKIKFIITVLIATLLLCNSAFSQVSLIRDAQIERFLRQLSQPIFQAANLNSDNITIYIVNDNSINAFVSGGQNIFINSGLITKYKSPDTLIGVIAHEAGHIAGGHLARSGEAIQKAQGAMFLSYLLGAGAIIAGAPDAGVALIAGGSDSANRLFMKYTRTQEESADQYAIKYLQNMSYPATGLVRLLEFFDSRMVGYHDKVDEYLLSHPVSRKRIDLIKNRTANWNFSNKKINNSLQSDMDIVVAKLEAFMQAPDYLLEKYRKNNSKKANYIKAIAYFRKGYVKKSLKLLDPIIKNSKSNKINLGFLWELKGQILYESGDIENAIISYNKALKLLDNRDSAQVKIAFASAIINLNSLDKDLIKLAISNLKQAENFEKSNPFLFKQLAAAYSKNGDEALSFLALAQYNFILRNKDKCLKYAKMAKEKLNKSQKLALIKAEDLIKLAQKLKKAQ